MEIKSVRFVKSSRDLKGCPPEGMPEYAFAGRSNVGKSSLLNLLVNNKNLAKTSSMPGKTKLINHFMVNDNWYLVDLPGYGYAKTSNSMRKDFITGMNEYLQKRSSLSCLFILIDCRHSPIASDLEFINVSGGANIPLALVFTKTDKISTSVLEKNLELYRKTLSQTWEELPEIFITSSVQKNGRDDILAHIEKCNKTFYTT